MKTQKQNIITARTKEPLNVDATRIEFESTVRLYVLSMQLPVYIKIPGINKNLNS